MSVYSTKHGQPNLLFPLPLFPCKHGLRLRNGLHGSHSLKHYFILSWFINVNWNNRGDCPFLSHIVLPYQTQLGYAPFQLSSINYCLVTILFYFWSRILDIFSKYIWHIIIFYDNLVESTNFCQYLIFIMIYISTYCCDCVIISHFTKGPEV